MKKIIPHDEVIELPKCMYHVKNPNENLNTSEIDINISDQVIKVLKVYFTYNMYYTISMLIIKYASV